MVDDYEIEKTPDQTSPTENIVVTAELAEYVEADKVAQTLATQYEFGNPDESGDYLLVNHEAGNATARVFDDHVVMSYTPPVEHSSEERQQDESDLTYALESLGQGQESRVDLDAVLDPRPGQVRDIEFDFADVVTEEEMPEYGLPSSGMPKRR